MKRLLAALVLLPVLALAQDMDPFVCRTPAPAVVTAGLTAVTVAAAKTGRRSLTICNSVENTGTPIVKCLSDGSTPVIGASTAGDALPKGACVTYAVPNLVKCIADTATTYTTVTECN